MNLLPTKMAVNAKYYGQKGGHAFGIYKNVSHLCNPKREKPNGGLAQLVQSICLTSRGS